MGRKDPQARSAYNRPYSQRCREALLPVGRERVRIWHAQPENKQHRNERDRQRRVQGSTPNRSAQRRYRLKLKVEAISHYGGRCACCGEHRLELLTIDHLNGGGAKHRRTFTSGGDSFLVLLKRTGYPSDYRVLCWNCNWSVHIGGGRCIHEREKETE